MYVLLLAFVYTPYVIRWVESLQSYYSVTTLVNRPKVHQTLYNVITEEAITAGERYNEEFKRAAVKQFTEKVSIFN